jgi:hypothetical protein
MFLAVVPEFIIDVLAVVEILDIDVGVQGPSFENEPLFEAQVERMVNGIAEGIDPGHIEIGSVLLTLSPFFGQFRGILKVD